MESADQWKQRKAAAIRQCTADLVLPIDGDKFPLTDSGDLREALADIDADVERIAHYNVVHSPQGPCLPFPCPPSCFDAVQLIVKASDLFQQRLAEDPEIPWIRFVPLPKVAARPAMEAKIQDGMHDIVPVEGKQPKRATADNIPLAHVALSSFSRFKHKMQNIREVFDHHEGKLAPGFGWHWLRWIELEKNGELQNEFMRSIFRSTAIEQLQEEAVVRTARQMLARLG